MAVFIRPGLVDSYSQGVSTFKHTQTHSLHHLRWIPHRCVRKNLIWIHPHYNAIISISVFVVSCSVTHRKLWCSSSQVWSHCEATSGWKLGNSKIQTNEKWIKITAHIKENICIFFQKALRTGTSTRLDERVFAMCEFKTQPLQQLMRMVHPDLYRLDNMSDQVGDGRDWTRAGMIIFHESVESERSEFKE